MVNAGHERMYYLIGGVVLPSSNGLIEVAVVCRSGGGGMGIAQLGRTTCDVRWRGEASVQVGWEPHGHAKPEFMLLAEPYGSGACAPITL